MNEQPPQPQPATVIRIQKEEIDRLNDNRVYLMAMVEDIRMTANTEIQRLNQVVGQLKDMLSADAVDEAEAIINGRRD